MYNTQWWIQMIDWRISTGVIFSIILMVWGSGDKRYKHYWCELCSYVILCGGSFILRFTIDEFLSGAGMSAMGYSLYIAILSVLFLCCYHMCCKANKSNCLFVATVALTVYRIAWTVNKTLTYGSEYFNISVTSEITPWHSILGYSVYAIVSICCYIIYRNIVHKEYNMSFNKSRNLFIIVLTVQMLLEFIYRVVDIGKTESVSFLFYFTSFIYCALSFAMLLMFRYLNRIERDKIWMEQLMKSKQAYYEISKEGILSLQLKCHDLKHHIALIRSAEGKKQFDEYLEQLEVSINEYNTVIDTGNSYLDVVLTEKNIICMSHGYKFTYIIDGSLFNFLSDMDAYALFGNIMDNAIESLENAKDKTKCFITMKSAKSNDMVLLHVENYFESKLNYHHGKLVTSKKDKQFHGFGLQSIEQIARKYGGMLSIDTDEHVFKLTIMMRPPHS